MKHLLYIQSLLAASLLSTAAVAADPQVNLGYATYEGTALSNGINQFLGMRYAAPPLGPRRLRRPEPPLNEPGIVPAKEHGPICYGVQGLAFPLLPLPSSEDCLFIDVYAPAAAAATTDSSSSPSTDKGLPVMLWLQGGAFNQLFNPNYNGSGIVEAAMGINSNGGEGVIVATFNYRVGPYGFLASKELQEEGNLNIGIHDQRAAIKWANEHIRQFGGDPERVTLFGTSIGGGSVLLHKLAYGGAEPGDGAVWKSGLAGAVNVPSFYAVEDVQFQYDDLLAATNCSDLACLRALDSPTFQAANVGRAFPGAPGLALFPYGPVVDGHLFPDTPSGLLSKGKFSRGQDVVVGSSATEGTLFVPQANGTGDVVAFLRAQYPALTQADVEEAMRLYSCVEDGYPGVAVVESPLYYKLAAMYGDVGFSCPALSFASRFAASEKDQGAGIVRLFRDHVLDPAEVAAGYIVPHTWELQAIWGPEYATNYAAVPGADSYAAGGANRAAVEEVRRYWLGFVAGGDPSSGGLPAWKEFGDGERLVLETNRTRMESVGELERKRCEFWERLTDKTHI